MNILKISVPLFMLFSVSNAEYPQTSELFFHSLLVNVDKMSQNYCDSISSKWIQFKDNECHIGGYGLSYNSPDDETVEFIFNNQENTQNIILTRDNQECVDPFMSDSATGILGKRSLSEIMFIELMRMQKYGIIKMDSIALDSFLTEQILQMKIPKRMCNDIEALNFEEGVGTSLSLGPNCCSLVEFQSTEAIAKNTVALSGITLSNFGKGCFYVHGVAKDAVYTLFDINGKFLKSGLLENGSLKINTLPVLLRINNHMQLLK